MRIRPWPSTVWRAVSILACADSCDAGRLADGAMTRCRRARSSSRIIPEGSNLDSTRQIVIFVLLVLAAIFYADFIRWIRPPKAPLERPTAQQSAEPPGQQAGRAESPAPAASGTAAMPSSVEPAASAASSPAATGES